MKKIIRLTESQLNNIILTEDYLDNVYLSDNFKSWFNGSKIVDENGKPLLLGHATRNFGFSKFNTPFIHLSSIDNASYFSGGNKRMFRFKKTLNKLSDEDIIKLYNKYFSLHEDFRLYVLDDNAFQQVMKGYDKIIWDMQNETDEELKKWGYTREEQNYRIAILQKGIKALQKRFIKYKGHLCIMYHNGIMLGEPEDDIMFWLKHYYPTVSSVKQEIMNKMFGKDQYLGKGGTYALCARIVNPLCIDCRGCSWDSIYIGKDNCNGVYDKLFDLYTELGLNKHNHFRGSEFSLDNETIAVIAQKLGYDGVIFKNIKEGTYGTERMDKTYIVFSTKQLKSPFENNGQFSDADNIWK